MRHPGDQCVEFSDFLSCQGAYTITLRTDSCLCNACHRDCLRSRGKPRWLGLSKHIICKHCFVCCKVPTSCVCDSISEWGPVQHFNNEEIKKLAEHGIYNQMLSVHQAITSNESGLVGVDFVRTYRGTKSSTMPVWNLNHP